MGDEPEFGSGESVSSLADGEDEACEGDDPAFRSRASIIRSMAAFCAPHPRLMP